MTDWQQDPGGLYIPVGAPDGVYFLRKNGVRFSAFLRLIDGERTTVTVDDGASTVAVDVSSSGEKVLVTATDTGSGPVPDLVWDNNLEPVYTEVGL